MKFFSKCVHIVSFNALTAILRMPYSNRHTTLLHSQYTTSQLRFFPFPFFQHTYYQSQTVGWVMLG